MNTVRILYIAEIVGKAGLQCTKELLPVLKKEHDIDFVFGNVDGATNGTGIGKNHAGYLRKLGLQVMTGGDMIFYKKDLVDAIDSMTYVLRPANFPQEAPGKSYRIISVKNGAKIAVLSLLGYAGFARAHADNPFLRIKPLVERLKRDANCIVVDYHGATTAEKKAFCFYADGLVSAVIGSHGRVQTADACVLANGTACITDAGRTGCINAVGGCSARSALQRYLTGIPTWTHGENISAKTLPELQGVILEIDLQTGKSLSIKAIRAPLPIRN